jgi:glycosyltransferase involved in cell wall biosynthesis
VDNFQSNHLKSRLIKGSKSKHNFSITVFIGLYNAQPYLKSIKQQIIEQSNQRFYIIIADNNSTDNTWEELQSWLLDFPDRLRLVKNKVNLGGTGNLTLNIDLINTKWFCTFHQDDIYKNNHTRTILNAINKISKDTIVISTDMGSLKHNGKIFARRFRASWLINRDDKTEAFISNLFVHNIYWPASAFQTKAFKKVAQEAPWHSATFPDTEIILKLCAYGRFKRIRKETMYYRENEKSESRSINSIENLYGVYSSLVRIFHSNDFKIIASEVNSIKRQEFIKFLHAGINLRVKDKKFADLLIYLLHERLIEIWGYNELNNLKFLAGIYNNFKSQHTSDILRNIALNNLGEYNKEDSRKEFFKVKRINMQITKLDKKTFNFSNTNRFYQKFFKYLPYQVTRIIFIPAYRLRIMFSKNHPWKFIYFRNSSKRSRFSKTDSW